MGKIEPQHMQSILFQKVGVFGTFLRRDALVVPVSGGLIIIQCKILLFTFYEFTALLLSICVIYLHLNCLYISLDLQVVFYFLCQLFDRRLR